jgi:hypothetical protein
MDMSAVITPKSDQINADDLISGPMTITIRSVDIRGGQEQPVSIFFDGSDKAFRPCKSMSRVLVAAWGPDANAYVGRSLTLYRDPSVKWGGMEVGGIRISAMSHLDKAMVIALTMTKGNRKPHQVKPLAVQSSAPTASTADFDAAMSAARRGRDAFVAHWQALPAAVKVALKPRMSEFEAAAKAAGQPAEDPLGLPPTTPTADDLARAEAEALAVMEANRREGEAA